MSMVKLLYSDSRKRLRHFADLMLYISLGVIILTPITNDMFIPSIPAIAQAFHSSHVQWMVSIFLLTISMSTFWTGPLIDRFGRKQMLMFGLILLAFGTLIIMISQLFAEVLLGRVFEAIGVASIVPAVMALVRDTFDEKLVVKVVAILFTIIAIMPVLSPLIGSYIQTQLGWKYNFSLILLLALLFLLVIGFFVQNSHIKNHHISLKFTDITKNYFSLLAISEFRAYIIAGFFVYAILFGYISAAPFLLMTHLHIAVVSFGWLMALNGIALVTLGIIISQWVKPSSLPSLLNHGTIIIMISGILLLCLNIFMATTLITVIIPVFICFVGVGIIRPIVGSGSLIHIPKKLAGSASSLLMVASFLGGAGSSIISQWLGNSAILLALFICVTGLGLTAACYILQSNK